jgi:MFS-type transporter involved in bile tolerance (Atg22 family)
MKHLFKNRLLKFWAYYDFANSSYVLIFQSFLLPVFFVTILQNNFGYSNFSWGLANGISTFLGVILAIFGGQYADKNERIKVFKSMIIYN